MITTSVFNGAAITARRCGKPPHFFKVLLTLALAVLFLAQANAQSTFGTIVGSVTDPSGAAMANVTVTLLNNATGDRRTAATDPNGSYQFVSLNPGEYKVDVQQTGFRHYTRTAITVEVAAQLRVDVTMQVGDTTQSVEVTASAALLQTENATLSQVVASRAVQELPLNGRNVLNLVALVPGVVPQGGSMSNSQGQNIFGAGNFQIGGGAANQSSTLLDGSPLNVNYGNLTAMVPTQDAISEFRVQTSSNTAEYGRYTGGIINLTSKSGTNDIHGSAYEFLRNKSLNAGTFFGNATGAGRPAFTQNQFGVNAGGPIKKDKTFIFGSYEGFRQVQGSILLNSVPTGAIIGGDFSGYKNAAGAQIPIYDPSTQCGQLGNAACGTATAQRTQFPGNIIPASRINPVSRALSTNLFALPNTAGVTNTNQFNFSTNVNTGGSNDQYNVRVDHTVSEKQRVFARYSRWTLDDLAGNGYGNIPYYAGGSSPEIFKTDSAVLADTYIFNATTILDVRGSFLRFFYDRTPKVVPGTFDATTIGLPKYMNVPLSDWPGTTFAEYNSGSAGQRISSRNNSFSFVPGLTKIMGRHTVKAGMELRDLQSNFFQVNSPGGAYTFTNLFTSQNATSPGATGNSYGSFLLGNPATGTLLLPNFTASSMLYQGYYVNDSFQVNKKLTVTAGLRWEVPGVWTERHDNLAVFNPTATNPLSQSTGLNLKGAFELVSSDARPARGMKPEYWKAFAPRIGVAYRLNETTVLRVGGGLFFIPADVVFVESPYQNPLNLYSNTMVSTLDNSVTAFNTLSNPYPQGLTLAPGRNANFQSLLEGGNFAGGGGGAAASAIIANNKNPTVYQWNAAIARNLHGVALEVGYSGSAGNHLPTGGLQLNQIPDQFLSLGKALTTQVPNPFLGKITVGPLAQPTIQAGQLLRPFPQYQTVADAGGYIGNSTYHALLVKGEKRFAAGGTLLGSYAFSKLISDIESTTSWLESAGTGGGPAGYQDFTNFNAEKSLSAFDTRERATLSYVVDLPFGANKKFLANAKGVPGKIVSGWGINGISTFQKGYPLHMTATPVALAIANGGGGLRPNVVPNCDPSGSGAIQQRLTKYFNPACFTVPANFTFGNASRTDPVLRGPGIANYDFAMFKRTAITERVNLEFRAEVFNIFNRVQFGQPNTTATTAANSTFGVITTQANSPRQIQFALRLKF